MTSYVTPKKNTAFKFYIGLVDQSNTKLLKANPTIAAGDFKVSTDGGAFANLTTLPSANPASGRAIMVDLSASEMNGDNIVFQGVDAAGAEWCDILVNIQTSARQVDDLSYPATSGRSMVVDAAGLVDANMVKAGPSGSGTAQTAGDIIGDTNDIQARLPAALTAGGNIKADALAVNGDTTSAVNLAKATRSNCRGTVDAGASTTSIPTSAFAPSGIAADQFKGRILTFDADTTTTALRGQATDITASSAAANPTLTVTALTTAPASGDTFSVT